MIQVSVFYPFKEDARFDMGYYCNSHMRLVRERLGDKIKSLTVEEGVSGGAPGSPPAFIAIGRLLLDSLEDFQTAFAAHTEEFMADIPNYTNIRPFIQISEVKLSR